MNTLISTIRAKILAVEGIVWDFFVGSTIPAFVQGAAVGAMIRGIRVADGEDAGRPL